ncbi:MAG TPA: hypothetical protein VL371_04955 [Gemmataceae bacterium]|jgi:hypothetical protein|nr:hypothetical protein [Gemmataceae bacterium]
MSQSHPSREILEKAAGLRLPPELDQRLQVLMDRNNEGALSADEREELECLVDCSETMSLIRAMALKRLRDLPE